MEPTLTSRTILIVEDSPEDRELYRRYLLRDREYDYKILEATLGRQGLELWQQKQPDVLLLDYRLPDLDGLEFLAQLKSTSQQPCLPVIMVTGFGNESLAVQAMKAGAQDYLVKEQITPERLHVAVKGAMEIVQLRTKLQQGIEREFLYQSQASELEQQVRAESEKRQESEQKFRAIFDQTYQFIGLLQPDGTLIEANQTFLDFGGLTLADVVGKPFWETYWWTISTATQERLQKAIAQAAQGEFVRYEVEVLGAGGQVATIDFSLKPVKDKTGQVVMLIPEGRDITEKKTTRKAVLPRPAF